METSASSTLLDAVWRSPLSGLPWRAVGIFFHTFSTINRNLIVMASLLSLRGGRDIQPIEFHPQEERVH